MLCVIRCVPPHYTKVEIQLHGTKMNVSMELGGWIKIIKIMSCNKFRSTFIISYVSNHVFLADNLTIWFYGIRITIKSMCKA
jgi:hypothetical protein